MPKPSVGRDVHYVSRGSADGVYPAVCRAAKITEVGDDVRVGLVVFNPDGEYFFPLTKDGGCAYDEGGTSDTPGAPVSRSYEGGTWHWPEPVDQGDEAVTPRG